MRSTGEAGPQLVGDAERPVHRVGVCVVPLETRGHLRRVDDPEHEERDQSQEPDQHDGEQPAQDEAHGVGNAPLGAAQVEVVGAEAAEEEPQQPRCSAVLVGHGQCRVRNRGVALRRHRRVGLRHRRDLVSGLGPGRVPESRLALRRDVWLSSTGVRRVGHVDSSELGKRKGPRRVGHLWHRQPAEVLQGRWMATARAERPDAGRAAQPAGQSRAGCSQRRNSRDSVGMTT